MDAMLLRAPRVPLAIETLPDPQPGEGELLIDVRACGVCRTDLHIVDGELPDPALPLVPGHEIVGTVAELGPGVTRFAPGDRVGVPWVASTCGRCDHCRAGRENLCEHATYTGYTRNGGYASRVVARSDYCFALPRSGGDAELAPWLCAGLIGYRAYRMAGEVARVGLYGFGAAAHIVAQLARHEGREVFAFTRPGDAQAQAFARDLGAAWAGDSTERPPAPLDAAILFASVGALVPKALADVRRGGGVVCAGIHMSDIPSFPYALLWGERSVRSVANLTRRDGLEFISLAQRASVRTRVATYPLERANDALAALRSGALTGAAVLVPGRPA